MSEAVKSGPAATTPPFDAVFAKTGRITPNSSTSPTMEGNSPKTASSPSPASKPVAAKKPTKKLLAPTPPVSPTSTSPSTTTTTTSTNTLPPSPSLTPFAGVNLTPAKLSSVPSLKFFRTNQLGPIPNIGSAGSSNENSITSNPDMTINSIENTNNALTDSYMSQASPVQSRVHQSKKGDESEAKNKQKKSNEDGRNKEKGDSESATGKSEPPSSSSSSNAFSTFLRSRKKSLENMTKSDDSGSEKGGIKSKRKNDVGYQTPPTPTPDAKNDRKNDKADALVTISSSSTNDMTTSTTTRTASPSMSKLSKIKTPSPGRVPHGYPTGSALVNGDTSTALLPKSPRSLAPRGRMGKDEEDDPGTLGDISTDPSFEDTRNTLVHQPVSFDEWRQQTASPRSKVDGGGLNEHTQDSSNSYGLSAKFATPSWIMSNNNNDNHSADTTDSDHLTIGEETAEDLDDDSDSSAFQYFDDDFLPVVFAEDPPKSLLCPLCGNVFKTPVIASCGHTFCRRCVEEGVHRNCPKDKKSLAVVVENIAVNEQIGDLPVHCRYGLRKMEEGDGIDYVVDPTRCTATFRSVTRDIHEQNCDFAPIQCPNNEGCGFVARSRLNDHLRTCRQTQKCKYHLFGCPFTGNSKALKVHIVSSCHYEGIKEYLQLSEERTAELQRALTQKDQEISFLRSMLGRVSEKLENLETRFEEKSLSLVAKDEAKDKSILDLRNDNFKLCEEISILNTRVNEVVLARSGHNASHHQSNSNQQTTSDLRCKGSLVGHQGPIWCLLVLGNLVFTGSADKTIKVWDVDNQFRCIRTLEAHMDAVLSLAGSDACLYSGSADRSVRVWTCRKPNGAQRNLSNDSTGSSPLSRTQSPASLPRSPSMPHSSPGVSGSRHGSIGKLDTLTFPLEHTWEEHGEQVCALEVAGSRLFSGSNRVVKVFDIASKEFLQDLTIFKSWVRSMKAFGNQLFCASSNAISIWDISTLHLHHQFEALPSGSIYCVEISQMHLYCGSSDSRIHVFDRRSLQHVATLTGHAAVVHDLAVSKTTAGYRMVSASFDGTLRVWSLDRNLNCLQVLKKHTDRVTSVTFANQILYSGGVDTTIKVWQHA